MEEDWGAVPSGRPTFSLFKKLKPEDEALKNSFVDIVVYNRWTRCERRLYQKLKMQNIVARIEQEKCNSMDDISDCLAQLSIIRKDDDENADKIDDLISTLECMKLKASTAEPIQKEDKKSFQIEG